jgi:hypothetical protein
MSEAIHELAQLSIQPSENSSKMGGDSRNIAASTLPVLSKKPVGQQIQSIYTSRLGQFTDSGIHYAITASSGASKQLINTRTVLSTGPSSVSVVSFSIDGIG